MSNERIGLVVAAVVALGVAFVLLSPGDDEPATPTAPTATAPTTTAQAGDEPPATTTTVAPPPPPAAPTFATLRVRDGRPVGGVQTITVAQGERARIRVTSTDTSDEIHLHGYDEYADVAPGRPARFSFDADATGIFEIELHGSGTQIGRLVVEP